jgi:hypothetical protein
MNSRTTISALGARLRSPRTLLAIVVSVVATAGVGGPLAYEAYHARDLLAAERAGAETRDTNGDGTNEDASDSSNADELADGSTTTTAPTAPGDGSGEGSDGSGGSDGSATTAVPGASGTVNDPTATTAPGATGSGATTAPPSPPLPVPTAVPTTVPEDDLVILVSVSSQLVPASPLAGKQVTGRVYVFIDLGPTVQWTLDGSAVGLPGGQLDTGGLAVGAHTLIASVGTPLGTLTGSATFTVAR